MEHQEEERKKLRNELLDMWNLVYSQLNDAANALLTNDVVLAKDVMLRERRVNVFELKIDSDCENYIALFSPVAIDLRSVLAILHINGTLERIGDFANGIAHYVTDSYDGKLAGLLEDLELDKFFAELKQMLNKSMQVFVSGDTTDLDNLYKMDSVVDAYYKTAINKISEYTSKNACEAKACISLAILARKMERIGDHCSNIVEDISFLFDSHIIKHLSLQDKKQ